TVCRSHHRLGDSPDLVVREKCVLAVAGRQLEDRNVIAARPADHFLHCTVIHFQVARKSCRQGKNRACQVLLEYLRRERPLEAPWLVSTESSPGMLVQRQESPQRGEAGTLEKSASRLNAFDFRHRGLRIE